MQVVALISGGKDSFFNAMHCVAAGHELAALANLHPAAGGMLLLCPGLQLRPLVVVAQSNSR